MLRIPHNVRPSQRAADRCAEHALLTLHQLACLRARWPLPVPPSLRFGEMHLTGSEQNRFRAATARAALAQLEGAGIVRPVRGLVVRLRPDALPLMWRDRHARGPALLRTGWRRWDFASPPWLEYHRPAPGRHLALDDATIERLATLGETEALLFMPLGFELIAARRFCGWPTEPSAVCAPDGRTLDWWSAIAEALALAAGRCAA